LDYAAPNSAVGKAPTVRVEYVDRWFASNMRIDGPMLVRAIADTVTLWHQHCIGRG